MRVFGGASPPRNGAYSGAFTAINTAINAAGTGPIAVAGFTEIVNGVSSNGALGHLCGLLGTNFYATVACGETALAENRPEFIGIGVNSACSVLSMGRILINTDDRIRLIHDISPVLPPTDDWLRGDTDTYRESTLDYRGLVYVVIGDNANNVAAIGFLHNRYPGKERSSSYRAGECTLIASKIPEMLQLIKGQQRYHVYVGGDFNVPMMNRSNRSFNAYAYGVGLLQTNPPIRAGGTTQWGSLFDYWYSDIPYGQASPVPFVHQDTMSQIIPPQNLSDHAATTLRIY